ncbi:MAG: hypothetical protein F6K18_01435 [Okeania sp. SIO2C2]|uniref:hypothetical protein n=1 Tax=Okeania sp. SIO2C2 TaxID=2607787 RepID=UPI0013BDE230|nr:hypothetical protein [Okeania sp. SIO2C2]NEP85592.1 hypothetical protein [Okeania sp. SIO2C2]
MLKKSLSRVGDNPPLIPPKRGRKETGDRINGNERGGRSNNCQFGIFLPNYEPKIRSMHERFRLKTRRFFRPQKGTCLYMSMLLVFLGLEKVPEVRSKRFKKLAEKAH